MAATILAATPAYAGQWMQDGNGWWWQNDDGSYPTAKWQWIDGDADGISRKDIILMEKWIIFMG